MKRMSFSATVPQMRDRTKTVTRRGNAAVWAWLGEAWLPHAVGPQS